MPNESNCLYYARRSYFGPIPERFFEDLNLEEWWSRRVPPPGPYRLFRSTFIVIVSKLTIPIMLQVTKKSQFYWLSGCIY